jgi:hypothetical protein
MSIQINKKLQWGWEDKKKVSGVKFIIIDKEYIKKYNIVSKNNNKFINWFKIMERYSRIW